MGYKPVWSPAAANSHRWQQRCHRRNIRAAARTRAPGSPNGCAAAATDGGNILWTQSRADHCVPNDNNSRSWCRYSRSPARNYQHYAIRRASSCFTGFSLLPDLTHGNYTIRCDPTDGANSS